MSIDTPFFRAQANIVHLDTPDMITRAQELTQSYPHSCCISPISPWKATTPQRPYFYYLDERINEEWIKTGVGPQERKEQ